jgi:hypothetical protein
VLPGSIFAAFAVTFPWHWLVLIYSTLVGYFEGQETLGLGFLVRAIGPETVERLGYGLIVPFVIIVAAAQIAPARKVGKNIKWAEDHRRY